MPGPRVALFVTCLVDLFRPSVGFATVKLLEDAGCSVEVPEAQTCCGQPAWNAGDRATAKTIAKAVIVAFEGYDYVVAPSGSCAATIAKDYARMFDAGDPWVARAAALGARTWEITAFLTDVMGVERVAQAAELTATYHDSCSGLRSLGVREQPRRLLGSVEGLELREMVEAEVCCGFGGTFCVKYPDISNVMVGDKTRNAAATGAELLLAGDLGCLMNMAGKASREGRSFRARHVVEVLAGDLDGACDRGAVVTHQPTTPAFKANAHAALANVNLQAALRGSRGNFVAKRAKARAELPEFDDLRDRARDLKDEVLANLDLYLEAYERQVVASGGVVHWAETAEDARRIVLEICRAAGAKTVNKGKTMIAEECGINDWLLANGITPVETDLGEYIIQLRGEIPSHIIAPAVHVTVPEVETAFRKAHTHLPADRDLSDMATLQAEARGVLREKYFQAEVGITGANMLIAETGQSVIVTNEGNGDLSQSLPRVHVVMASLEKIVPTLEDAATVLRVLARSATGQEMSVYTTFSRGPRRAEDPDGPEEYHVVLLDNGRSNMLGTDFQDMLRCIRCGACMNHCPVYQAVGGHAYGWVYPGPMGAVLTPSLIGVEQGGQLPNASTFCGRCEEVCPMRIPLPKMMRNWREREFEKRLTPGAVRWGLGVWAWFALRPALYRLATRVGIAGMRLVGGRRGRLKALPLAGGWTGQRDFPAPQGDTFMAQWKARRR